MSHFQQEKFVEIASEYLNLTYSKKVFELGSYDVNGSIKPLFSFNEYIGVDVSEGPNVDKVYDGKDLSFLSDDCFDLSISCNCFEHNPEWKSNLVDMHRVTKEGGYLIIQIASRGFDEHGTTRTDPDLSVASQERGWNYYRNVTVKEFLVESSKLDFEFHFITYNPFSRDLYFFGKKGLKISDKKNKEIKKEFKKLLKPIFVKYEDENFRYFRLGWRILFSFPLFIAMYLFSDPTYQEIHFNYHQNKKRFKRLLRSLIK